MAYAKVFFRIICNFENRMLDCMKPIRLFILVGLLLVSGSLAAQENNSNFATQQVDRKVESLLLIERLGDIAYVDVVRLAGPPPAYRKETGTAFKDSLLGNQLKFYSYAGRCSRKAIS